MTHVRTLVGKSNRDRSPDFMYIKCLKMFQREFITNVYFKMKVLIVSGLLNYINISFGLEIKTRGVP